MCGVGTGSVTNWRNAAKKTDFKMAINRKEALAEEEGDRPPSAAAKAGARAAMQGTAAYIQLMRDKSKQICLMGMHNGRPNPLECATRPNQRI